MIINTERGYVELTREQMRDVWIEYEHMKAIDLVKTYIENWCFDNNIPDSRRDEYLANEELIRDIAMDYEDRMENNSMYDEEWAEEMEEAAMGYLDYEDGSDENA